MADKEKFSYSRLETFEQCPYKFKKKYEEGRRSSKSSLALEIGTLVHKGKELVAQALMQGGEPDYDYIRKIVEEGYDNEEDERGGHISGTKELREKYFFDWVKFDDKSGLTYEQKLDIYFNNLRRHRYGDWEPFASEMAFEFDYDESYSFGGFIDLVEQNKNGDLRIIDYKSSRKVFTDDYVKTPLQMVIYELALQSLFGKGAVDHIYDFVFLGIKQGSCSQGYLNRGKKKIDKLFLKLEQCRDTGVFTPSPSPLCHWCDYCATNENGDDTVKYECPHYSKWTPSNKTFEVNRKFDSGTGEKIEGFKF